MGSDMSDNEVLKHCPFCGGVPYFPTKVKKNLSITSCANNKCPIFGLKMKVSEWQKRDKIE